MLRALALLALGLTACGRDFSGPPAPRSGPQAVLTGLGLACDAGADCQSGHCTDGVCCRADCASSERCDLLPAVGSCTPRPAGAPCDAGAQCPTGFCADGVCCESACPGPCQSCALPGAAGRCLPAPAGEDPRRDCADAGPCQACFGGLCAPAFPGTDPQGACGPGRACGADQRCQVAPGQPCAAASACAVGACLVGACFTSAIEPVRAYPMSTYVDERVVRRVGVSAGGRRAVLFSESKSLTGRPYPARQLLLALAEPDAGFAVLPLQYDFLPAAAQVPFTSLPADLAFQGEWLYTVASDQAASQRVADCGDGTYACRACERDGGYSPCGLYGLAVTPGGALAQPEPIDPGAEFVYDLRLALDEQGQPWVAYDPQVADGGFPLLVRRRGPAGWGPARALLPEPGSFELTRWAGGPAVAVSAPDSAGNPTLRLLDLDGGDLAPPLPLPAPAGSPALGNWPGNGVCGTDASSYVVAAAPQAAADGTLALSYAATCFGGATYFVWEATLAPQSGADWQLKALAPTGEGDPLWYRQPLAAPGHERAWMDAHFVALHAGGPEGDVEAFDGPGQAVMWSASGALGPDGAPLLAVTLQRSSGQTSTDPPPADPDLFVVTFRPAR